MNQQLIDLIRERLQERRQTVADNLVSGGAKNYDVYQKRVGYADALNDALDIVDEAIKELRKDGE